MRSEGFPFIVSGLDPCSPRVRRLVVGSSREGREFRAAGIGGGRVAFVALCRGDCWAGRLGGAVFLGLLGGASRVALWMALCHCDWWGGRRVAWVALCHCDWHVRHSVGGAVPSGLASKAWCVGIGGAMPWGLARRGVGGAVDWWGIAVLVRVVAGTGSSRCSTVVAVLVRDRVLAGQKRLIFEGGACTESSFLDFGMGPGL